MVKFIRKNKKYEITCKTSLVPFLLRNKKGDLELDEIGKLILGALLLIILIYIVAYLIRGEFSSQSDKVSGIFSVFK